MSACLLILLSAACTDSPQNKPLRLGTNVWPGYEPLYLARHIGVLDSKRVQLVEYTSASQVMKAFRNELLDAAAITLDEAISLLESGEDVRIVLVTDVSSGGDVLLARPEIQTMHALEGRRIGVEHTALGAYFVSRMIELHQLDKRNIELVPLEVAAHERAYHNDEVDAVVTFDPVRSKLLAEGAVELFSSREIPGEIVDVIVVRASLM